MWLPTHRRLNKPGRGSQSFLCPSRSKTMSTCSVYMYTQTHRHTHTLGHFHKCSALAINYNGSPVRPAKVPWKIPSVTLTSICPNISASLELLTKSPQKMFILDTKPTHWPFLLMTSDNEKELIRISLPIKKIAFCI